MKSLILTIFVLFFTYGFSYNKRKEILPNSYVEVLKDTVNSEILAGKVRIRGIVFFEANMNPTLSVNLICDSLYPAAYSLDDVKFISLKSDGSFEILLDTSYRFIAFQLVDNGEDFDNEKIYFENYKFVSQHEIDIKVTLPSKRKGYEIMVDKPVIYTYSENSMEFSVNLKAQGKLTFTYPQLPENYIWRMKIDENGKMLDENNAEFPYLFWEAAQENSKFENAQSNSREIIKGNKLVAYFENNLSKLGLNSQEKTDFITYWCPKFSNSETVLVKFFIDENCSLIGDLEIQPKPTNFRRVFVTFEVNPILNELEVVFPLSIDPIKRNGFTVVEWGGSIIPERNL